MGQGKGKGKGKEGLGLGFIRSAVVQSIVSVRGSVGLVSGLGFTVNVTVQSM